MGIKQLELAMAFDKPTAESKINALSDALAKHITYLFGFAPNKDFHHWMNNGVLGVLRKMHNYTYLTKGKRINRDWLFNNLYVTTFDEMHCFTGNAFSRLSHKPEYTPLVSRRTDEEVLKVMQANIKEVYSLIVKLILTTDYTAVEQELVKDKITDLAAHFRSVI
jgi:hypothetical protein